MRVALQMNPDKRPVVIGDLQVIRGQIEDLPVLIDGVEWDADERSLFRLDALAAVVYRDARAQTLVDARNRRVTGMSTNEQVDLPGRIRQALGDRFSRLNAEYNALKDEIEQGAVITKEQAFNRMAAKA